LPVSVSRSDGVLHKYVEQSRVMESLLPRGKSKPGPSPQTNAGSTMGLDSLLRHSPSLLKWFKMQILFHKIRNFFVWKYAEGGFVVFIIF
jgi:hypothetical protein